MANLSNLLLLQSDCLLPASVRQDPAKNHHEAGTQSDLLQYANQPVCLLELREQYLRSASMERVPPCKTRSCACCCCCLRLSPTNTDSPKVNGGTKKRDCSTCTHEQRITTALPTCYMAWSCMVRVEECILMRCMAACLVQMQAVAGPVGLASARVVIFPYESYLCLYIMMSKARKQASFTLASCSDANIPSP